VDGGRVVGVLATLSNHHAFPVIQHRKPLQTHCIKLPLFRGVNPFVVSFLDLLLEVVQYISTMKQLDILEILCIRAHAVYGIERRSGLPVGDNFLRVVRDIQQTKSGALGVFGLNVKFLPILCVLAHFCPGLLFIERLGIGQQRERDLRSRRDLHNALLWALEKLGKYGASEQGRDLVVFVLLV